MVIVRLIILFLTVITFPGLIFIAYTLFTAYYYRKTKKEFGGVTGDTAGYYLVFTEGLMLAVLALFLSLRIW